MAYSDLLRDLYRALAIFSMNSLLEVIGEKKFGYYDVATIMCTIASL